MTRNLGVTGPSFLGRLRSGFVPLLLLALVLRMVGIGYGLPHLFHADEALEVFRALRLGTGGIDLELNRALKGGLFYLLFAEYGAFTAVAMALGRFESPADFGRLLATDPTLPWLIGRATVALFGAATVVLVWRGSERRSAALFSAALLAVSFLHVKESQLIGLEVPLGFLALLLLLTLRDLPAAGMRGSRWSGALLGFATMTKITGAALVLPLVLAHWVLKLPPRQRLGRLLQAIWVAALVYGIGNPGIWVNAREIWGFFSGSFSGESAPALFQVAMLGGRRGPAFYFEALQLAFGWGGTLLALGGVLMAAWPSQADAGWASSRERRTQILMLSFALPYLAVLASSRTVAVHRYIVPVLPVLAIFAGEALEIVGARLTRFPAKAAVAPSLVVLLLGGTCLAEPALRSLRWDVEVCRDDTRLAALRWIESHVADGAGILLAGNRTFPAAQTAPIAVSADHLAAQLDHYTRSDPGKARYLKEFAIPACARRAGPTYHPHYIGASQAVTDLAAYRAAGVEWAVLTSRIADNYRSGDAWKVVPATAALYAEIWRTGQVVAQFAPLPWRCAGPTITILHFDPALPRAVASGGERRDS